MCPDQDPLQKEIDAALEGVNLQEMGSASEEPTTTGSGERLYTGVIVGIHADDVIADLGPRMQGVCSLREFDEPPTVGEKFKFTLHGREDELWILSRREAQALAAWDQLEPGKLVKARVNGQNQGGLEMKIGKHDAFMPASQVALERVEDFGAFIGQTFTCEVVEIDRGKKRAVLSRRKVLERERDQARAESIGNLQTGLVLTGKVTRIESFGAFVDIGGGLEGLAHVSNLSHSRVENAGDLLSKGQEVKVKVLKIEDGGRRIGLGMKQLEPDPWDDVEERLSIDSIHTGKITRIVDFGAFVELRPGLEGLLHVSQMSHDRPRRPQDVVKVGEELSVRVTAVDAGARRVSLSRFDSRDALIGSEDAVESDVIDDVLDRSAQTQSLKTNLGSLFKRALDDKKPS